MDLFIPTSSPKRKRSISGSATYALPALPSLMVPPPLDSSPPPPIKHCQSPARSSVAPTYSTSSGGGGSGVMSSANYKSTNTNTDINSYNEARSPVSSSSMSSSSSSSSPRHFDPSKSADRFIPNRASIDFDFCSFTLLRSLVDENKSENGSVAGADSTIAKHNQILSSVERPHGTPKRLVDCFEKSIAFPFPSVSSTGGNPATSSSVSGSGDSSNSNSGSSSDGGSSSSSSRASSRAITNVNTAINTSSTNVSLGADVDGLSRLRDDGFSSFARSYGLDEAVVSEPFGLASPRRHVDRVIPSGPSRILDAPELMDDYYLNLLSWGRNNVIAVALHSSVYLWHAVDQRIESLFTLPDPEDYVTSVQWCRERDNLLAIGTSRNSVELWDTMAHRRVREMGGHTARVSSLSWQGTSAFCLSSGGRDGVILNHDTRLPSNSTPDPITGQVSLTGTITSRFCGHIQEVCGLAWNAECTTLASGGNENKLCLWDPYMSSRVGTSGTTGSEGYVPRFVIQQHTAAVKALSWCPWSRNTLASGGGTADRTIRIWNSTSGSQLKCVDTGSQVCSIEWGTTEKEIVSSHGFSDNQLILWRYKDLTKIKEFRGHTARVLHMAKSPDGRTICSASADETIRFWEIFDGDRSSGKRQGYSPRSFLSGLGADVR